MASAFDHCGWAIVSVIAFRVIAVCAACALAVIRFAMARPSVAWAMMARNESYKEPAAVTA